MFGRILFVAFVATLVAPVRAHDPSHPFYYLPRPELFDWVERLEPRPYRHRFNRPRYIGGKIAYTIAPSSQEAMSWHEHQQRGSYRNHAGPLVRNYYYPKPWEVLPVGPRTVKSRNMEEVPPGPVVAAPPMRYDD